MAEDEERRDGSKRSQRRDPARNTRRDPPLIEAEAQDVTPQSDPIPPASDAPPAPPDLAVPTPEGDVSRPEPEELFAPPEPAIAALDEEPAPATHTTEAPTQAETPRPRDPAPEPVRPETRSPWGALAALGFVVLAAGLLYLFYQLSSLPPDTSAAVADLRTRLAAVEARPATGAAGLGDRLTKVEGAVNDVRAGVDALGKRVDTMTAEAASQPNTGAQVAELQTAVADLKTDIAGVKSNVASLPRPDVGRIETRIGDMDQRLAGLQTAVSGIPHIDLGPLTGKVDALESRLKPIEAEAEATRSPEQVAQRRAAPVAVTAQAISGAIDAGQAFPQEFHALQALGADPAKLAALQAVADNGAPSLRDLQAGLAEARDRIVTQGAAPASGSYMDRLVAGASNLVQVRPLGSVVGDTPAAVVARINEAIGNDDLAAALAEWHKLPESSQSAAKALAERIKLRLDAEQAARDIAANAIGAMASPRG